MLVAGCERPASDVDWKTNPDVDSHSRYFPIATGPHAVDCNACHGDFDTFQRFDCLGCHDQERTDPPHGGLAEYRWASEACLRCHPAGDADSMSPADHARWFPIGAGTAHAALACTTCHVDRTDRRKLDCATCHGEAATAPGHEQVAGFSWGTSAAAATTGCLRCHADSQVNLVRTHLPFAIEGEAKHAQSACLTCHPALRTEKPWGADFARVACEACHAQALDGIDRRHTGLGGYASDSASCLTCHPDGGPSTTVDHAPFFPIGEGTAHPATRCGECHATATDRTVVTCTTCHVPAEEASAHAGVGGFAVDAADSSGCLRCHADSQVTRVDQHAGFGIATGAPHWRSSCVECHSGTRTDKPWAADFAAWSCTTCHAEELDRVTSRHDGIAEFSGDSVACRRCHPDGGAASFEHAALFPIGAGTRHEAQRCAECHVDPTRRRDVDCATCHTAPDTDPQHLAVGGYARGADALATTAACLRCHVESQVAKVDSHTGFSIAEASSHWREGCVECHPAFRSDKPRGADFRVSACTTCHAEALDHIDARHDGVPDYASDSSSCLVCHPSGGKATVEHDGYFPIGPASKHRESACADCHPDPTKRAEVDCATCHKQPDMAPEHVAVGGYAWGANVAQTSATCLRCHADSQVDQVRAHTTFGIAQGTPHWRESCLECHPSRREDKPFGEDFERHECTTCHVEAKDRIDARHHGIPDYARNTTACLDCHPDGGPSTSMDHSGYFPVDPASAHRDVTCRECHVDAANRRTIDCATCHERADMIPAHARVGGFAWGSTPIATSVACLKCHADSQVDRLATHTKFGVAEGTPHWKENCLTCHPAMRADKPWGEDFTKRDCTTCHADAKDRVGARHAGIGDYAPDTASCLSCHPDGGPSTKFDHARLFPVAAGSAHANLACAKCHPDATDRRVLECTGSCHTQGAMTTAHGSVGGHAWSASPSETSQRCVRCHADSQVDRLAAHRPFGLGPTTKHWKSSCLECHATLRADKPWGEDFARHDCKTCHAEAKDRVGARHAGITGYATDTASCMRCHPDGGQAAFSHGAFFPIEATSAHRNVTCAECHPDATNRRTVDCATCHVKADMTTAHGSVGGYAWGASNVATSVTCLKCHADSQVDAVAAHTGFAIGSSSAHWRSSCLTCHPAARVDKPWGEDFTRRDCATCHSEAKDQIATRHAGIAGYAADTASCLFCHPTGGPSTNVDHVRYFPIDATSKHRNLACAKCHVDSTNRQKVDCTGSCHVQGDMTTKHGSVGGHAWDALPTDTSKRCVRCHADSQVDRVASHLPFGLGATTKHWKSSCVECHATSRIDKPFGAEFRQHDCTTCHAEAKDQVISRHDRIPGVGATTADCLRCHPDGGQAAFAHDPYFPIDPTSKHALSKCVDCHPTPTNRRALECTTCHTSVLMAPKHTRVGGYAWQATTTATSALCTRCHADSQVDRLAQHKPFLLLPNGTVDVKHAGESCLRCHPAMRPDKPWATSFATSDCTPCHSKAKMDDTHKGRPTYAYVTTVCLTCHANGAVR